MAAVKDKKNYVVDFESYYDKKEGPSATIDGVPNYVQRSYAYLMSIVGPGLKWVGSIEESRQKFPPAFWNDPGNQFWAANSNFDQAWAQHVWELPRIQPWRCILDLGATQQMPQSLTELVRVLFSRKVDKAVRDFMNGKHFKDLSDEDRARVTEYCMNDAIEEMECLEYLPDASDFEDQVAMITRGQNRTGIHIDVDLIDRDKTELNKHRHRMFTKIPWTHANLPPLSYDEFREWCAAEGVPSPASFKEKDNPECDELIKAHPKFAEVIEAQRAFKKTNLMIKKIDSIESRLTDDGRLPLEMMYCGARHTRRWSSRGVNVQNLHKDPLILSPVEGWTPAKLLHALNTDQPVPKALSYIYPRHWLIPPPGKVFLILDYAQIEPRCLNWIAGNDDLLDYIRSGFSVYEAYARSVGAWSGNELLKVGDPDLYKSIKAEVLGLGYGMGSARYMLFNNVDSTVAAKAVDRFRTKNPKIPKLWKKFDQIISASILDRSHTIDIEMPNNEWLRHFNVKVSLRTNEGGWKTKDYHSLTIQGTYGKESEIHNLWGGVLTENVTQRMARDAMAWAILELTKAGFQVVFSSHDEVILSVDDDRHREHAKEEAIRIMSITPPWAPGLPLGVEGDFATRYTKL